MLGSAYEKALDSGFRNSYTALWEKFDGVEIDSHVYRLNVPLKLRPLNSVDRAPPRPRPGSAHAVGRHCPEHALGLEQLPHRFRFVNGHLNRPRAGGPYFAAANSPVLLRGVLCRTGNASDAAADPAPPARIPRWNLARPRKSRQIARRPFNGCNRPKMGMGRPCLPRHASCTRPPG